MDDADTANGENPYERDPDDPDTSDAADARRRLSEDDDSGRRPTRLTARQHWLGAGLTLAPSRTYSR